MSKEKTPRALPADSAKAVNRIVRVSPQKLNLLAQMIRGKKVTRALSELEFSQKRAASIVRAVVYSAMQNAENNHGLDIDSLIVSEAYVGKRLVMKRFMARARGRSSRIEKVFSQITVVVKEVEDTGKKPWRGSRKGAGKADAASAAAGE